MLGFETVGRELQSGHLLFLADDLHLKRFVFLYQCLHFINRVAKFIVGQENLKTDQVESIWFSLLSVFNLLISQQLIKPVAELSNRKTTALFWRFTSINPANLLLGREWKHVKEQEETGLPKCKFSFDSFWLSLSVCPSNSLFNCYTSSSPSLPCG